MIKIRTGSTWRDRKEQKTYELTWEFIEDKVAERWADQPKPEDWRVIVCYPENTQSFYTWKWPAAFGSQKCAEVIGERVKADPTKTQFLVRLDRDGGNAKLRITFHVDADPNDWAEPEGSDLTGVDPVMRRLIDLVADRSRTFKRVMDASAKSLETQLETGNKINEAARGATDNLVSSGRMLGRAHLYTSLASTVDAINSEIVPRAGMLLQLMIMKRYGDSDFLRALSNDNEKS